MMPVKESNPLCAFEKSGCGQSTSCFADYQCCDQWASCIAIATLGDIAFQHFTFAIYSPPEIMLFAIYFHENFVQMPLPV